MSSSRARRTFMAGLAIAASAAIAGIAFTVQSGGAEPGALRVASGEHTASRTSESAGVATPAAPGAVPPATGKATTAPVAPREAAKAPVKGKPSPTPLPTSRPPAPILGGQAPKSMSAEGKLVRGFPSTIPVAPNSVISSSSVASSNGVVQAALDANSSAPAADVTAFYQSALTKLGLSGRPLPSVGGSTAQSFARADDSITLTVTPLSGGRSHFTILAILRAAG